MQEEAGGGLDFPASHNEQAEDSTLVAALVRYLPSGQLQMMERSDKRNGAFL